MCESLSSECIADMNKEIEMEMKSEESSLNAHLCVCVSDYGDYIFNWGGSTNKSYRQEIVSFLKVNYNQ